MDGPSTGWDYVSRPTSNDVWNSAYDAAQLLVSPGSLRAIVWTHASQADNTPFPQTNLNNEYQYLSTERWTPPQAPPNICWDCNLPWDFITWRRLADFPPMLVLAFNPLLPGRVPMFQKANEFTPAQYAFSSAALAALSSSGTEVRGSMENGTGAIRGRVSTTGVLLNAGTAFFRGAFFVGSDGRVDYLSGTGQTDENGPATVRMFVAGEGTKGTVFSIRSGNIIKQDVASDLLGAPHHQATPIVTNLPVSPKAGAWDGFTRALYVLDVTGLMSQSLRLLRIGESGASTVLWQSPVMSPGLMPTNYYIQTTSRGEVFMAVSFSGSSEWAILGTNGVAKYAGTWSSPLAAAPFVNDVGVTAPFLRSGSTTQGPLRFESTNRAQLPYGICSTIWLKNFVPTLECGDAWTGP